MLMSVRTSESGSEKKWLTLDPQAGGPGFSSVREALQTIRSPKIAVDEHGGKPILDVSARLGEERLIQTCQLG